MSAQVELNEVDQHIKAMMLTYPTLFRSRFSALQHLFMSNGTGYEWNAEGKLACVFDTHHRETMDYSDLEDRQREVDQELASKPTGNIYRLYAGRAAALKREFAVRQLIEADIDLYATEHVMGENTQNGVEWMKHFDPQWCAMRTAPFGAIDLDWALAAEETMEIARSAIYRHLAMYLEGFDRDKADPKWLRIYDQLGSILLKLDDTTGTKQRVAKQNEVAMRIIDEILAEEQQ
ncbi:hypothetical protein ACQYZY_28820 [Pseudomonas aeruginosa]|jgi:hypothetical protein|uniref:hypothetical protein n=1 Tax=Pseudomonas aeruginosa TaxID=287 RepID=UPI003D27CD00